MPCDQYVGPELVRVCEQAILTSTLDISGNQDRAARAARFEYAASIVVPCRTCEVLRRMQNFEMHAVPIPALTCRTAKCPIGKQRQWVHFIEWRRKPRDG